MKQVQAINVNVISAVLGRLGEVVKNVKKLLGLDTFLHFL